MGKTPADSLRLVFRKTGSTSRFVNPSALISECLVDVSLPQELITEILVRLPVKSLLRFKCVSKSWLSLITDPQFIRSHISKTSLMEAQGLNLHLLYPTESSMNTCSLYSALNGTEPSMHISAIEFSADRQPIGGVANVGIVNGLVCLNLKGTDLCVWNPALDKIKHFNFYPETPSGPGRVRYIFSFGYEESNDDYKVVCLQTVRGNDGDEAVFYIYSLKADCWWRIGQLIGFYLPEPGVFANGKIYWSSDLFVTPDGIILSLDMSSEKFVELQPPKYERDAGRHHLQLGVSGGRPFLLSDHFEREKVELWVLDKRGVEESWCKFVSIPYTDVNHEMFFFYYRFICISSNGEIVFGNMNSLLVYNWKTKEYRLINLVAGVKSGWRMAAYAESLVWPDYA